MTICAITLCIAWYPTQDSYLQSMSAMSSHIHTHIERRTSNTMHYSDSWLTWQWMAGVMPSYRGHSLVPNQCLLTPNKVMVKMYATHPVLLNRGGFQRHAPLFKQKQPLVIFFLKALPHWALRGAPLILAETATADFLLKSVCTPTPLKIPGFASAKDSFLGST